EGATLVLAAVQDLFQSIESNLSDVSGSTSVLKFGFRRADAVTFVVEANFGLNLHFNVRRLADNSAGSALLTVTVFQQMDRFEQEFDILWKEDFSPSFHRGKQVVWKIQAGNRTISNEELAAYALDQLQIRIEQKVAER